MIVRYTFAALTLKGVPGSRFINPGPLPLDLANWEFRWMVNSALISERVAASRRVLINVTFPSKREGTRTEISFRIRDALSHSDKPGFGVSHINTSIVLWTIG